MLVMLRDLLSILSTSTYNSCQLNSQELASSNQSFVVGMMSNCK